MNFLQAAKVAFVIEDDEGQIVEVLETLEEILILLKRLFELLLNLTVAVISVLEFVSDVLGSITDVCHQIKFGYQKRVILWQSLWWGLSPARS